MRTRSAWLKRFGGLMTSLLVRRWMSTLDYQAAFYDPRADVTHPDFHGPAIFVFWHESILAPFYLRPRARIALLVSRHADAEWLTQTTRYAGYQTVRGSSARGGAPALKELFDKGQKVNLAITPDGPRGPRRTLAPGAIYLSSKLGIPLTLIAVGYERPWRMPTWDRFALPRPYSRCRIIMSPALQVPADLDRDAIEHHRRSIETLLNQLTAAAEEWAATGVRWAEQQPARVQPSPSCKLDRFYFGSEQETSEPQIVPLRKTG